MWYVIPIFFAILIGLVFFVSTSFKSNQAMGEPDKTRLPNIVVTSPVSNDSDAFQSAGQDKPLARSRQEIERLLRELSKSPIPKNLSMGAKCYEPMEQPQKAEYVCPKCGQRTLYHINHTAFVTHSLPACRRVIKTIQGLDITLDESQFCKKCSPAIKAPELCVIVKYKAEQKFFKTCNITVDDLTLLSEFSSGKKKHQGDFGREFPLKNYLDRLKQILGMSPPVK